MSREFLNYDPYTGITQYHNYDPDTDTSVFESIGDCEPTLELNRKIAREIDIDKGIKEGWWWYACLPMAFLLKIYAEQGICFWKKDAGNRISKILEDPEYSYLKMTSKTHIISAHD